MSFLFFDLETTGFSRTNDGIIEIAGIIYDNETKERGAVFHEYIKPQKPIPLHISQITGITNAQVANCRSEKEVLKDFFKFIEEHNPRIYIGHNIDAFDIRWLQDKGLTHGLNFVPKTTIDTYKIARAKKVKTARFTKAGNPSYAQESLAEAYNITYDAHSAIGDVDALIQLWEIFGDGVPVKTKDEIKDRKRMKLGF